MVCNHINLSVGGAPVAQLLSTSMNTVAHSLLVRSTKPMDHLQESNMKDGWVEDETFQLKIFDRDQ